MLVIRESNIELNCLWYILMHFYAVLCNWKNALQKATLIYSAVTIIGLEEHFVLGSIYIFLGYVLILCICNSLFFENSRVLFDRYKYNINFNGNFSSNTQSENKGLNTW